MLAVGPGVPGRAQTEPVPGPGVEPEVKARSRPFANHALSVLPKLQLVEAREQFQVITLWHVLEHLHDLRGSMEVNCSREQLKMVCS